MTTIIPVIMVPASDAFTDHLGHCAAGCDVKLDGTGPLCARGQQVMESVDWPALARLRDRATDSYTYRSASLMVERIQQGRRATGSGDE